MTIFAASKAQVARRNVLETATLRDFSGLWNASDTELNLKSKYLPVLTNWIPDTGTGLRLAHGYAKFADLDNPPSFTVSIFYPSFDNRLEITLPEGGLFPTVGTEFVLSGVTETVGGVAPAFVNEVQRIAHVDSPTKIRFTIGRWTEVGTHPVQNNVTMTLFPAVGDIVDLAYFDAQLFAATSEGWIYGIDDRGVIYPWWSPNIDRTRNRPMEALPIRFTNGSLLATIQIPNAEGVPNVGDLINVSNFPQTANFNPGDMNREFEIVTADKGNNIYTINVGKPSNATVVSANAQVEYPLSSGWHFSRFVNHDTFNRGIIWVNGVDKPVKYTIDPKGVDYLRDPANGSNFFIPVCKYIACGTDYVVMGNSLADGPATVYIASTGTDAVFEGAAEPNDSTQINLANIAGTARPEITGLAFYSNRLVASFNDTMAVYQLGNVVTGNHIPQLVQVIDEFGSISQRSMLSFSDAFLACDDVGVVDVAKGLLQEQAFKATRASEIIAGHIAEPLSLLPERDFQRVWSLHDKREGRYYLFIPLGTDPDRFICYQYVRWPDRGIDGWSLIRDWNFTCGCRTAANRLFVAKGRRIYRIGSITEPIHNNDGAGIKFALETPWVDINTRMIKKQSRHLMLDTQGTARFNLKMFVDYLYWSQPHYDVFPLIIYDHESERQLVPTLEMVMTGGDGAGYGAGFQSYGGGRRTNMPLLYAWPATFKQCKFRIDGEATEPLKLVSISVSYLKGSVS